MSKIKNKAALLASQIFTTELIDVVCREISFATNETAREHARALLSGYLGDHTPAQSSSLREYVKSGLTILEIMPDIAVEKIDEVKNDEAMNRVGIARDTITWLKAFAIAAKTTDVGDFAIGLAEDWVGLNDLNPEEP